MKVSSIAILKKELQSLSQEELLSACLRLAKYKVENKELLNYVLFDAQDEENYIERVKEEITLEMAKMNSLNYYFAKKTIRRVLKIVKKQIKYSGNKKTEIELLIFFCETLKNTRIPISGNTALENLFNRQIININKALSTMHEDLQYDYKEQISNLTDF
jgi:hypothetical protein